MSYEISFKDEVDIEKTWSYATKTWSSAQANRFLSLIFEKRYLAESPETGKDFKKIRRHYCRSIVKSHLIFLAIMTINIE